MYCAVSGEALAVHKKVLGLDVAEDNMFGVHVLEACDELNGGHAHRLERESASTHVKEVFERGTKKLHHESVVFTTRAKIEDLGHAR